MPLNTEAFCLVSNVQLVEQQSRLQYLSISDARTHTRGWDVISYTKIKKIIASTYATSNVALLDNYEQQFE